MEKRIKILCVGLLVLGMTSMAQATLYDRGNGMIYDSDQDLTWLQDANYAETNGRYTADGQSYVYEGEMAFDVALSWAGRLVHHGYDDWRLPTVVDSGGVAVWFCYYWLVGVA